MFSADLHSRKEMIRQHMKISIDVQSLLLGNRTGIGFYQTEIMKALLESKSRHEFALQFFALGHTQEKMERAKTLFGNNVRIEACHWFSNGIAKRIWLLFPLPYRLFFPEKTDVSCFFNFTVPPFARGKKAVVVYDTVVKDHPETMNRRTRMVLETTLARSMRRADRIITISDFSKRQIMKHYGVSDDKISVVPCGFREDVFNMSYSDEDRQRTKDKYGINGQYILYLGTLEPRKNIERIVEAYGRLKNENRDCPELVLAGGKGWLYESIFERVKSLGIEDSVVFTGYVDDNDVPLLMNGAMIFCFPSLYEGFGMPPLEAMACGTPVITSNSTSLPEVVGDAAISIDPCSVDELSDAMKRLTENSSLREELRQKGLAQCRKFSWKSSADLFMKELESM